MLHDQGSNSLTLTLILLWSFYYCFNAIRPHPFLNMPTCLTNMSVLWLPRDVHNQLILPDNKKSLFVNGIFTSPIFMILLAITNVTCFYCIFTHSVQTLFCSAWCILLCSCMQMLQLLQVDTWNKTVLCSLQ